MTQNEILALILTIVIGLLIIIIGVFFLFGKASFLIAGYNTMSKTEKDKYDVKSLTKFIGKIIIPIGLTTPLVAIAGIYKLTWLIWCYIVLLLGLSIFLLIYANTKNRFKKEINAKNED